MDFKTLNLLQTALVKDPQLGERVVNTSVKRKLPAEVAKSSRTLGGVLFGRRKNAAQDLAKRIVHHSGGKRHLATSLVRKVLQRMDSTFKGIKQELLRDEPAVDNLLVRTVGNLRKAAVDNGFQTIAIADLDFAMSNARQWPRSFLKRHGYVANLKDESCKATRIRKTRHLARKGVRTTSQFSEKRMRKTMHLRKNRLCRRSHL